jgi:hypothetical protein
LSIAAARAVIPASTRSSRRLLRAVVRLIAANEASSQTMTTTTARVMIRALWSGG